MIEELRGGGKITNLNTQNKNRNNQIMSNFFKKNSYAATLIYKDYSTELLEGASVSIDINPDENINSIIIEVIEKSDTSYLFSEIGWIVLDLFQSIETGVSWSTQPLTRKIFEVSFSRYNQDYFYVSKNTYENFAEFKLEFKIKNLIIEQDSDLIPLEQFIRVLKLNDLID